MLFLNVVVPQIDFVQGDPSRNAELIVLSIKNTKTEGDTLFVFPELAIIGYYAKDSLFKSLHEVPNALQKIMDITSENSGLYVGVGFPELRDRILYNSYAIIGKGKILGIYRKHSLPTFTTFEEHRYFKPAQKIGEPTRIGNIPLGVAICYDAFFSEIVRIQALMGAKLVLVPSASPIQSKELWEPILRSRAIENNIFIVYSNHVGYKDSIFFYGGSRIVDPRGKIVVMAGDKEETLVTKIDISITEKTSLLWRPMLRDINLEVIRQLYRLVEER